MKRSKSRYAMITADIPESGMKKNRDRSCARVRFVQLVRLTGYRKARENDAD